MRRIVVPFNGSRNALRGLEHAIELASRTPLAEIHLVNVQPAFSRHVVRFASRRGLSELRTGRARQTLGAGLRRLAESGAEWRQAILTGELAPAVSEYAEEVGANEIVLGASRGGGLSRLLAGSRSARIEDAATVPVTAVAGERPGLVERYGIPAGVGLGLAVFLLANE